jgi:hypothetical protein
VKKCRFQGNGRCGESSARMPRACSALFRSAIASSKQDARDYEAEFLFGSCLARLIKSTKGRESIVCGGRYIDAAVLVG